MEKNLDGVDDPDIPTSEIANILHSDDLSAKIFKIKKSKKKTNNCKWFDNDLRSKRKTLVKKESYYLDFLVTP